ncbi:uncharacterized protein LOC114742101 [Neltuma alba]|uniref:uncharacterized protein LOC114742101 n=1 Tax=Neltuma alba TaxID=207710 RepID=UPI0010A2AB25|nr:uncharacterized protein LOC114742101 [Prosopis alba]
MGEVFPKLSDVILRKLPKFISICEGIDFKDLQCDVEDCPKYREISQIQEEPKNEDSENQATASVLQEFAEITEETSLEIQVKDPALASEKQASGTLAAKSQLRGTYLHELEDEHKTSESTMQLQQEDFAETKTTKASQKTNVPFDDNSIDIISKERAEGGPLPEDVVAAIMEADLAPRNSSKAFIIPHQKEFPLDLKPSESRSKTSMKCQEKLADRMIIGVASSVVSQVGELPFGPSKLVASMKETHEQGSQEDNAAKEVPIIVQSTDSDSRKQTRVSPIFEQITQSIKDTTELGLEENYAEDDVVTAVGSTNSDSRKQSTGPIDNLSGKHSALSAKEKEKGINEKATSTDAAPTATPLKRALTVIETGDHSSIQEEAESEKPLKAIIPRVTTSLHHQSQNADDAIISFYKLGVCEIFQLVELKDGEAALLAQALQRYPQLLLPQEHRSQRMIAWSYRVLVDILAVLAAKTPCSITSSEKSTLETNLCDATLLGFDKEWIDSVRSRVFGVDMSDVLAAEEEIQVKEAELETCDVALEQVRKQRVEARERLAVTRRQLEMAQTEFEATDSQLSALLEGRKKLTNEITEFREIISAKDRPFGI